MYECNKMYEYNEEDGGIQFQPYDDELINKYLIPKLEGKPREEITTKDVYSKEPWLLDHPMGSFFRKNEWYYFVTRTQLAKNNIGCGKKVKRKITREEDSGVWRANAKENITDKETKMVIGEKQSLAFVKSMINNKKQKRGDGTCCDVVVPPGSGSSWIMTEYMLPQIEGKFRELVICKIHAIENSKKKKGHDDHHEASTSSYHHQHHIDSSTSEQHPNNVVDHGTFLAPMLEQQQMNLYHYHIDLFTLDQQPISNVDHGTSLAPSWKQPTNIVCHEAFIPHHHEFIADYSTKQQPVNEAHGHVPEIPLIGSEKNDQVLIEASGQVSKKDEQLYIDAPLGCLGPEQEAEEGGGGDMIQELINSLSTMNGLGLPMEEDDDLLNYDTPFIDQDLLDQYATLRPQETL